MSCLTENTIVLLKNQKEKFYDVVAKSNEKINFIREVYENDEMNLLVITFDCNGTPNDLINNASWFVIETNFLDGEDFWTQEWSKGDVEKHASETIKSLIGPEEFEKIKEDLRYGDGRI